MRPRRLIAALVVLSLAAACSNDGSTATDDASTTTVTRPENTRVEPPGAATCDDTDPTACLLPWPNDRFTRADATTTTGRRLDLPREGMPVNAGGVRIDPTEWNRNDGFSPASNLLVHIDDLDVESSGLPPVTDIGASLDDDSALVLLDLDADRAADARTAAWAELDSNATDPAKQALIIVPASSLLEGHRYAVALRGLRRTDGSEVEPSASFAAVVADPTEQQDDWLSALEEQGDVDRDEIDIAWSFTVASAESLSGRLRHMAGIVLDLYGDGAPEYDITGIEPAGAADVVTGTFVMPKFLTGDGGPGSVLNNADDPNGIPEPDGEMTAEFTCTVPTSATPDDPAKMIVYGHGLLGSRSEVLGIGATAAVANVGMCATDYLGMSAADVPTIIEEFRDFSRFRTQPDRMLQGHIAFVLLGRLLTSHEGLSWQEPFAVDGRPAVQELPAFLGASQGGILGGAASAVGAEWDRVVLAVGGLGYNLLLRRSIDFAEFVPVFEESYPDELDQLLTLELAEQLWDRGENAGYAQHLTGDTYDGLPPKPVLLLEAFGDHQVANVSTQKLARTLGVRRRAPTLADGRSTADDPYFGIDPIPALPTDGSGLYVWDFGTPAPPDTNTPPTEGDDPHGDLSDTLAALTLLVSFVEDGELIDVCAAAPCTG